jgi:hypothetical protein
MSAGNRFLSLMNFGLGGLRSSERSSFKEHTARLPASKRWLLDVARVRWRLTRLVDRTSVIYLVAFVRPVPHQGRFLEAASAILISLTRVKVLSGRAGLG